MRPIDADELMELYDGCDGLSVPIAVVRQNIEDAPTIDAEPVVHGHWGEIPVCRVYNEDIVYAMGYKCNQCGRVESKKEPYCHCGAKMDEVSG